MHSHRHLYKIGEKGAILGIAANITLWIFKLFAGIVGRSSAMIADALHTASDLLTSVIVLVGFKVAQIPPDDHHPYGHARAESIAGKIVALILIAFGIKVFFDSLHIITGHKLVRPGSIALIAAVVSIAIKYVLFYYVYKMGKRINSTSLIADAYHHKSDAISSIAALIGIGCAMLGLEIMDPIAGMIVAGMVIKTGIVSFHSAFDELLDAAPSEEFKRKIEKAILATEGVRRLKSMHIRKLGIDLYIDAIIDVDKSMSVEDSHIITVMVKRNILKDNPNAKTILIHVEPYIEK